MSESAGRLARWMAIAAYLCAILILPVAWDASQGWLFPDGTSYLDLASSAIHDSPAVLLKNAYWSPAYPAILALTDGRGAPRARRGTVRGAHAQLADLPGRDGLLQPALATFCNGSAATGGRNSRVAPPSRVWSASAYALFLLSNMNQTLWYITPDMLVQGLVYLSAACALRLFPAEPVVETFRWRSD